MQRELLPDVEVFHKAVHYALDYEELAGKYRYLTKLAHDAGKKMLLPAIPATITRTSGAIPK